MNAILIVKAGPGQGRKIHLPHGRSILIGRSPENELQIYGEEVSREHSEIVSAAGQFQLIDHSSNGTFVNGKRIKRHKLEEQDLIQIGDNKFEFQESESAAPTKEDVGTEVKFVPHLSRSTSTQVFGREELDQTLLLDTSAQVVILKQMTSIP